MKVLARIYLVVLGLMGLGLLAGGAYLASLGGSIYYLITGLAYVIAAVLLWRGNGYGGLLAAAVAVFTVPWAFGEAGLNYWALFPRLLVPFALAALALLLAPSLLLKAKREVWYSGGVLFVLMFAIEFGFAFVPHGVIHAPADFQFESGPRDSGPGDWSAYAGTTMGLRYAPFTQINRKNVSKLKVAWIYHTGGNTSATNEDTPLEIDNLVYIYSCNDQVTALDADTGERQWIFDPEAKGPFTRRCRGLGYYQDDGIPEGELCHQRIVFATTDARLIEVDAKIGGLCTDFGNNGTVDLTKGLGKVKPRFYDESSAPLVADDKIVIGSRVLDNQRRGEPSGVIRAFDARTGKLVWAWDLGAPSITGLPPEGETYTRGTPNMWTTAAYDPQLGLVYAPLGNATPDYFGVGRPPHSDEYTDALVALDVDTGRVRWKFQTVHHDIWDYDLASQPALIDLPDGHGATTPAILLLTKRGQLFLLNRATGKPIAEIEEKPVPQNGAVSEERLSPTQPYSVGMPTIGDMHLTEKKMWGMTMFDQLVCRIEFHKLRYDGDFTPIGITPAIQQPSNIGGLNWGSASVNVVNSIAYMNDVRIPGTPRLVPRYEYKKTYAGKSGYGPSPQLGTPYGVKTRLWMSPLSVPCVQPPFGTISAVNLKTRKLLWQVPAGTAEQLGPMGDPLHLPIPIGMPTTAGTVTTGGNLVFFAGFQDFYIRAYDAATGEKLWQHPLPVGSSATPMTYISSRTGKQYIVLSAGGAARSSKIGDYVIAFTLPSEKKE